MKDFGDVIYVIAIIAWVIYSFVSKSNKQKNKGKRVEESTSQPSNEPDLKKMLEEFLGKKEIEEPAQTPANDNRKYTIEPVYDINNEGQSQEGKALNPVDDYKFGKYKTFEDEPTDDIAVEPNYESFNSLNYSEPKKVVPVIVQESPLEVKNLDEIKESAIAKDFDIEKAIIYSEILKRPKWAF